MTSNGLTLLFEIRLMYQESKPPVSDQGKVGEYIGSGEGSVNGPGIDGTVHWTLFEAQSETVCQSNLFGVITTDEGAIIKFDSMGIFLIPEKEKPHLWHTSAGVGFETDNKKYTWMNSVAGVWQGQFDMQTYTHHYHVYGRFPGSSKFE